MRPKNFFLNKDWTFTVYIYIHVWMCVNEQGQVKNTYRISSPNVAFK